MDSDELGDMPNLDALSEEPASSKGRGNSMADALIRLADEAGAELFHDQFAEAFARVPVAESHEVLKIRSQDFRAWLTQQLWDEQHRAPASEAMQTALNNLEARALCAGAQHTLANRMAHDGSAIWYDLG